MADTPPNDTKPIGLGSLDNFQDAAERCAHQLGEDFVFVLVVGRSGCNYRQVWGNVLPENAELMADAVAVKAALNAAKTGRATPMRCGVCRDDVTLFLPPAQVEEPLYCPGCGAEALVKA